MKSVETPEEPAIATPAPPAADSARKTETSAPLSVGVLVDLYWEPEAGGHVKCWERFAEAATHRHDLDLTVYFLADKREVVPVAENVRYVTMPPLLPTDWFHFLHMVPDHTDLAPLRPRLWKRLKKHHVIHSTDAFFAMARTALHFARWHKRPLVSSIHTDTPGYTRLYTRHAIDHLFRDGKLGRFFRERWHWNEIFGVMMERRLQRYLQRCDWVLGNEDDDSANGDSAMRSARFTVLRRGIEKETFHPRWRDGPRLNQAFGIAQDRFIMLCVGRLDPTKDVLTLARAARLLLDRGVPLHVIFVGEGNQRKEIEQMLGRSASLPGLLPQDELPWIYASTDLFVFPSRHEISPNVVLEAQASGLPLVVSTAGGSAHFIPQSAGSAVQLEETDPAAWAETIEQLRRDPERRVNMGRRARQSIETSWPSWNDVLTEDLLPVWQKVAREKGAWG